VLGKVTKSPLGALIKEERGYEMRFDNMQVSHARACVLCVPRERFEGPVSCFLFPVSSFLFPVLGRSFNCLPV